MPYHDPGHITPLITAASLLPIGFPVKILENAKAYVSLVALVATALMGSFATDSTAGKILTAVVAVAGAFATWSVPNQPAAPPAA